MIAACLIFKDAASYLHEWLAWHAYHSISRFYLYDNGSTDDWRAVVEPWRGHVDLDLIPWPGPGRMLEAYSDCLDRARKDSVKWLAFLDDDEFLTVRYAWRAPLHLLLSRFRYYAGVAVPWLCFGSGGAQTRETGWVTETFIHRAPAADRHVKCIVQPRLIVRPIVSGHQFEPKDGTQIVTEDERVMTSPFHPDPDFPGYLSIHHYLVKSWEEWAIRRGRPNVDGLSNEHPESTWREWDVNWSAVRDTNALDRLPPIKALAERVLSLIQS